MIIFEVFFRGGFFFATKPKASSASNSGPCDVAVTVAVTAAVTSGDGRGDVLPASRLRGQRCDAMFELCADG